jgi:DNA polymerase III alpha subunit (gram-positive type)
MKVFVGDTETGGLDPEVHSIFSVGALVGDIDSGEIIEKFEALHRLPFLADYRYTAKAIEIHGITPEKAFAEGLSTKELQNKFVDLWHNHGAVLMGGHNYVAYDVPMLAHQLFHITVKQFTANFTYRFLDTLPVIRLITGHDNVPSGASLKQAVDMLNIDMDEFGSNKFHGALFDSIACFKIMHKFRKILIQPDVLTRLQE